MTNLERALKKASLFDVHRKEWVANLTPSEILALVEAGAQPVPSSKRCVQEAEADVKAGRSGTRWFYFFPGKLVHTKLGNAHRRHDKGRGKQ